MKQGSTTDRHKRDTIAILPGYLVKDFTTQDHHLERQPYDYGTSDADPPHRPQDGNHEDGDQHGEAFLCLRRGRHSWVTQAAITQTTLALACVCVPYLRCCSSITRIWEGAKSSKDPSQPAGCHRELLMDSVPNDVSVRIAIQLFLVSGSIS